MKNLKPNEMTKIEFINLQKEWESIEFNPNESLDDNDRQSEIIKEMSDNPWVFDMDTGEVVRA